MKLKAVILENFRRYQDKVVIPINDFTAIIGKNDAGKSTVLEALSIFFDEGTIKIETSDASVNGNPKEVKIGCIFSDYPESLIIDTTAETSLKNEYLLNANEELEIIKIYDCSLKTPKQTVYVNVNAPLDDATDNLLDMTINDLKAHARSLDISSDQYNASSKVSIRMAIYNQFSDSPKQERYIQLSGAKQDKKTIWEQLQNYLPIYSLFQSDRKSHDQDKEVQEPMKLAIKSALSEITDKLQEITNRVEEEVQETANRTLLKLQESYPDLSTGLKTEFLTPKWDNVFKMELSGDDGISVNKRGSGFRRLLLLSFFQAEAERKREGNTSVSKRPIIYAIEEPETSQHPNYQVKIIKSLKTLAELGEQVILTTHVPALAECIDSKSFCFVDSDPNTNSIRVRNTNDSQELLEEISTALGVFPDHKIKVLVFVEGVNDIEFLTRLSSNLNNEDPSIIDLSSNPSVAFIPTGGATLRSWVQEKYLKAINRPEIHIYDRDKDLKYQSDVERVNQENNHNWATLTQKTQMESYIDIPTIESTLDISLQGYNEETDDIVLEVAKLLHNKNSQSAWDDISEDSKRTKIKKSKRKLNTDVASKMTKASLLVSDPDNEVLGWLERINCLCNAPLPQLVAE